MCVPLRLVSFIYVCLYAACIVCMLHVLFVCYMYCLYAACIVCMLHVLFEVMYTFMIHNITLDQ